MMERIALEKARVIATNKGLKPGRVKGTEGVQFTKGKTTDSPLSDGKILKSSSNRGNSRSSNPAAG